MSWLLLKEPKPVDFYTSGWTPPTANWARSLALEIVEEHGASPAEQFQSCKDHFAERARSATLASAAIFEPLFLSLTCALTVTSASLPEKARSLDWSLPALIVSWYYTQYTAVRAMAVAAGTPPRDTHRSAIDVFGGNLRDRMPHPLNMQAQWVKKEEFECRFPGYPCRRSPNPALSAHRKSRSRTCPMGRLATLP
ncbi:MAG: hypothetical protein ACT4OM_01550 [Actinomycetota bacterium]